MPESDNTSAVVVRISLAAFFSWAVSGLPVADTEFRRLFISDFSWVVSMSWLTELDGSAADGSADPAELVELAEFAEPLLAEPAALAEDCFPGRPLQAANRKVERTTTDDIFRNCIYNDLKGDH
jgi:hypothetical protein